MIEVVPSSNPCSQTDTEEFYLLKKNICTEGSTQDKYLKADFASELKEQWQGKMFDSLSCNCLQSKPVNL